VDATTNGGITRLRHIVADVVARGRKFAPHMFPHVHSQVLGALGHTDAPIEWGIAGTGVHPMDDSLRQPEVSDGLMAPLPEQPGLGRLVDRDWITSQPYSDPHRLLEEVPD
jgi:L-alanine-DL-glutamate epimerase-like enolase superfamily enzyme